MAMAEAGTVEGSARKFDALGRPTDTWDAQGTRTGHTDYTPAAGGPLTKTVELNALDHTTTTEYAPDWGVRTATTDPNGNRTELSYDSFGQLSAVWLADRARSADQAPNYRYVYKVQNTAAFLGGQQVAEQRRHDLPHHLRDLRRAAAVAPDPDACRERHGPDRHRDQVRHPRPDRGDVGRLHRHQTGLRRAGHPAHGAPPAGTETVYDAAGRATVEKVLTNGKEFSRTKHTYSGDTTLVEPPAGAPAVREKVDARGRTVEKLEYDGNAVSTNFTRLTDGYDHADRLAEVKDDDGNRWAFGYDFLGHKDSTTDPDAGATSYEFDDLDRLVSTTDARGVTLGHTYDLLGRPTGRLDGRVPVVDGKPAPEDARYLARWTYDTVAKGRLTSAIRYVGGKAGDVYAKTNAKYDKLYRVLNEQCTISKSEGGLAGASGVWTIANAYNTDGSLKKRTVPAMGGLDQEVLDYGDTEQGMRAGAARRRAG
ncbi:YD repeat-containing protein [Streptomyces sp. NBC_00080]|uniref:hypothetical protein n=1 Tax=Streptomyces sp. NBC_00080 TaxID=2975645 RepID=UPI0032556D53